MFVKICGTTNLADAELAVELGADALGFIFAPSKRRVTVEQVAAITPMLPYHVHKVGVFTNPDARSIVNAVREARLTAVQLHMPYDPALIGLLRAGLGMGVKLWQVMGVNVALNGQDLEPWWQKNSLAFVDPRLSVVLLDSVKDNSSGGLGQTFPWASFASFFLVRWATARAVVKRAGIKPTELVIAGGLNAENLGGAVKIFRPWGVDVVSGVEASPGRKSPERMKAFFEAVHGAG